MVEIDNPLTPDNKASPDITSDLPIEPKTFLQKPEVPERHNYQTEQDYNQAIENYNQKIVKYNARKEFLKDLDEGAKLKNAYMNKLSNSERTKIIKPFLELAYESCCIFDKEGKASIFKPALAAEQINKKERFLTDIETGILYYYDGRTWIKNAENHLRCVVSYVLDDENKVSHFNNIIHHLTSLTMDKIVLSKKLALENGLLNVETQEFEPYTERSKYEIPFIQLNIKYDPAAECPNWLEFVKQVVNQDDILTLQEWSGYCLLPNYSFHKIMWIVGSGRNGKGVWQRTIENILGQENVGNVGLEEFDGQHRFSMAKLYGKLVNFCSEPQTKKELQTNLLKYATGQDTIEAEIKNKQSTLKFKNTAKITVLANKFPRVSDQTTAFKERRLFLKFPNEFTGENTIRDIEQNWLTINDERAGIFNWMLQGLKRLLEQGHFSTSQTQEQTELEFLRASDSVSAFVNECASYDRHYITTREEAKTAYEAYCDYYGLEVENDKRFTQKLKDTAKIKDTSKRIEGKKTRVWEGVNFKVLAEEDQEVASEEQQTLTFNESGTGGTLGTRTLSQPNSQKKICNLDECKTPVPTVPCVPNQRTCFPECKNFRQSACPAPNYGMRDGKELIPLGCTGYECKMAGERFDE